MHRTHLVGHRADAADPRDDVRGFGEAAAAQEGLEEARRLEDAEPRRTDPAVLDMQVEEPSPSTRAM
ncbi:hypothetical protein ACE0DR_18630 [Azotobacter sp. CWF10]